MAQEQFKQIFEYNSFANIQLRHATSIRSIQIPQI